jgi:hypothetical protein
MRYFIDFDRTIFETDLFKAQHKAPRLFFRTDELDKYLYPEVPNFLRTYGNQISIVTYGVEAFIMAKVTNALSGFAVSDIVYTKRGKGHVLKRLCRESEGPFVFVDDAIFQLESVSKRCPYVNVIEMRRDDKAPDGRWPVIHSLDELLEMSFK